jgi:peptide-methionine (S)-S-oxide reductase
MIFARKKAEMTDAARALPGRASAIATAASHFVNGNPLKGPYPAGSEQIIVAMGCYWSCPASG